LAWSGIRLSWLAMPAKKRHPDPQEWVNEAARAYGSERQRRRSTRVAIWFDDGTRADWPVPETPSPEEGPFIFGPAIDIASTTEPLTNSLPCNPWS
jgi:hypothetical protein